MIGSLFHRGVVLPMGARRIRATSAQGLRDALAVHVGVSSTRMAQLGTMGDRALGARADALDELRARLASALSGSPADLGLALGELAANGAPLEGPWSDAVAAARQWTPAQSEYQRAVLRALADHLAGERDCVRTLLANRGRPAPAAAAGAGDTEPGPRQRLVFAAAELAGDRGPALEFNRMPKGDPLEIPIADGQALEIMLAQHRFLVVCGTPWLLVDEFGEDVKLKPGRNVVGRSAECDAVVHEGYRAISRRHVVLETEGASLLRITDISSLGTFVPRAYLENRLH